jgi:uncharacterized UBP type Zn finger protein
MGHHMTTPEQQAATCTHLDQVHDVRARTPNGCEECLAIGSDWVHLRLCLSCGHVGCCDNSPNKHATAHYRHTHEPLIQSFEPGEDWGWCYVDEVWLEPAPLPAALRG